VADERAAISKLVDAINEGNEPVRSLVLEEAWGEQAGLIVDGTCMARGRDELNALIQRERQDPGFHVRLAETVRQGGGSEWSRWEVRRLHEPSVFRNLRAELSGPSIAELHAESTEVTGGATTLRARAQDAVLSNPLAAFGLAGGALYLALRIPVSLFYGDLGVTADEVGFGPEVLVPQSLPLLAIAVVALSIVVGLLMVGTRGLITLTAVSRVRRLTGSEAARRAAWILAGGQYLGLAAAVAVFLPLILLAQSHGGILTIYLVTIAGALTGTSFVGVGMGIAVKVVRLFPALAPVLADVEDRRRRSGYARAQWRALAIMDILYIAIALLLVLPAIALNDAASVREGGAAGGRLFPWRALPVSIRWKADEHPQVGHCHVARLLGTSNGQTIVFDTRLDRVVRVPVGDAAAVVRRRC
jgi:hypothetical protein